MKHTNAMPLLLALRELESTRFAAAVALLKHFMFRYKTIGNAHISPMTDLYPFVTPRKSATTSRRTRCPACGPT